MSRPRLALLSLALAAPAAFLVLALPADPAGAKGTKRVVPDDYPSIQAAVDAAADGDTVEIRSGLHGEEVVVTARNDLTLKAKKGAGIQGGGLTLVGCARPVVSGLTVRDAPGNGIAATDCSDLVITGCRVEDAAADGIATHGCMNVLVTKCVVTSAGRYGVYDRLSENVRILKNVVDGTESEDGIGLSPGAGAPGTMLALVAGNRVLDAGDQGIQVCGTDIRVEKNVVERAAFSGIATDGSMVCTGTEILKNTVRDSGMFGIGLGGLGGEATGNKVYGSGLVGLHVQDLEHLVSKNTIVGGAMGGIRVEADRSAILKNKVSGADDGGIIVEGSDNLIEGNTAVGNGPPDFRDTGAGNTVGKNRFGVIGGP